MKQNFLTLVLLVGLICSTARGQEKRDVLGPSLPSVKGEAATIYYDKSLAGDPQQAMAIYDKYVRATQAGPEHPVDQDKLVDQVNKLTGFEPTDRDRQIQKQVLSTLDAARTAPPIICLVKKSTLKEYLRQGNSLPGCSYDKVNDKVQANLKSGEAAPATSIVPADDDATMEKAVQDWTASLDIVHSQAVTFHELAAATIFLRIKPADPYFRWFSDGFTEGITALLLDEHVSAEAAQKYLAERNPADYADIEKEINLQYWQGGDRDIPAPLKEEMRLASARRAFATFEARRLLETHGIEKLPEILAKASPGQQNDSQLLLDAIQKVTGEDMRQRLTRYQSFNTRADGEALYVASFNDAEKQRDLSKMIYSLLRVRELRENWNLNDDVLIANLLRLLGDDSLGDEVFQRVLGVVADENKLVMEKKFLAYCLAGQKFALAQQAADHVLEADPNDLHALAARMMYCANSGDLDRAKQAAEVLVKVDKDPNSQYVKAARRIQMSMPTKRP